MSRSALVRQPPPDLVTVQAGGPVAARFPIRVWLLAALLLTGLAAGITGAGLADVDVAGGLWNGAGWLSEGAARIRWGLVPVIVALTALHYLTSAIGVRATASGTCDPATTPAHFGQANSRLGLWEITTAQFAGAAANRLAPAGLGTAAVTCRYLTRRGLPACAATTTVAVVGLVRAAHQARARRAGHHPVERPGQGPAPRRRRGPGRVAALRHPGARGDRRRDSW